MRSLLFAVTISLLSLVGCSETEQGRVVGVKASFSLGEAASEEIERLYYEGAFVLETSNGERIEALCDTALAKNIRGGQLLEIAFDKELDSWKVVKIISESPEANEQAALPTGRVVGRFISSEDGEPLDIEPALFHRLQGMTEAEQARVEQYEEQHGGIEVTPTASGGFQISNVYPGSYHIVARYDILGSAFEVEAGGEVDLGDIEVPGEE